MSIKWFDGKHRPLKLIHCTAINTANATANITSELTELQMFHKLIDSRLKSYDNFCSNLANFCLLVFYFSSLIFLCLIISNKRHFQFIKRIFQIRRKNPFPFKVWIVFRFDRNDDQNSQRGTIWSNSTPFVTKQNRDFTLYAHGYYFHKENKSGTFSGLSNEWIDINWSIIGYWRTIKWKKFSVFEILWQNVLNLWAMNCNWSKIVNELI